ncbi:hypothetical protein KKG90_07755 [Candidatus Bipolaricaulota bacterium]|nr:hypothetical protein [Candidatus Bipolaricaulota bacterium]
MSLRIRLSSDGHPEIWANDQILVSKLDLDIPGLQHEGCLECVQEVSPWEWREAAHCGEAYQALRRTVRRGHVPLITAEILSTGNVVTFSVTAEQTLSGLSVGDTFDTYSVAFPRIVLPSHYHCLLTTYGLGPSGGDDGVGGYWPEAMVVESTKQIPSKAFAPLVLFDEANALAIAPASQFLTSALINDCGDIVRTLHGSIDRIESGTRIETLFAWGESVTASLMHAGDVLLARGGKTRPTPRDSIMTTKMGWWNAYGGYYTEPIHPLTGVELVELLASLKQQQIPIGYIGLDLWYPYKYIGQALHYSPDTGKYEHGIHPIAEEFDLPVVLHLSALAQENEYQSNGSDPAFYRQVAEELIHQHAVVAWHDWLRTQQHLTPALRNDPVIADAWFNGMAKAMADKGISVLTCMHTMGMILASTGLPNVIAARSSIDYLFAQPEALDTLERLGQGGFKNEATPLYVMRRQNLLVGFTYYAMGVLPFYDLFLTQWQEDVGGISPQAEAILRALSCGPMGIGDGPGQTDVDLVHALVSSTGDLLHPDHPPYPDTPTLGKSIEVYRTEHTAGAVVWEYVIALNTTQEVQSFSLPVKQHGQVIWDGMHHCVVEQMQGMLASGELAYYVIVPEFDGIAPLGLWNKTVPAPSHVLVHAEWNEAWNIWLDAPGETFAIWSADPIIVTDQDGRELSLEQEGPFALCLLSEGVSSLRIARRWPT